MSGPGAEGVDRTARALRAALKSQYHAGLAMLRDVVERFPDELWTGAQHVNAPSTQLADRLRNEAGLGTRWVGSGAGPSPG